MALHAAGERIALDTKDSEATQNFISHAHSDHIGGARSKIGALASEETRELLKARNSINISLAEPKPGMEMPAAGHILGSRQLYINSEELGYSIVYTGDYQLQESSVAKKIEIKPADIVIMDSTYTDPAIEFDDRDETVSAIQRYILNKLDKGIVMFGTFSLGKAQELIKACNDIGVRPCVTQPIEKVNKVYEQFGIELDYATDYDHAEHTFLHDRSSNFVGIVTNNALKDVVAHTGAFYSRRVYTAVASGFAKMMRFNTDVQFPLSDHADFKQAVEYVERSGARFVYSVGENAELLASNLKKMGYAAAPLANRKAELAGACKLESSVAMRVNHA